MNTNLIQSQEAEHIRWQPIVAKYAKPRPGTQSLAGGKYADPLFRFVGLDDLEHSNLLLDHAGAGVPRGGLPDADLYHLPRLRTRLVLQIAEGQ